MISPKIIQYSFLIENRNAHKNYVPLQLKAAIVPILWVCKSAQIELFLYSDYRMIIMKDKNMYPSVFTKTMRYSQIEFS